MVLKNELETGTFTNYYWINPVSRYVEKYGLEHYALSIRAIEEITKRSTGEFAIRPFLERYPEKALKQMYRWSEDDNFSCAKAC